MTLQVLGDPRDLPLALKKKVDAGDLVRGGVAGARMVTVEVRFRG